jgi:hypothetical protein
VCCVGDEEDDAQRVAAAKRRVEEERARMEGEKRRRDEQMAAAAHAHARLEQELAAQAQAALALKAAGMCCAVPCCAVRCCGCALRFSLSPVTSCAAVSLFVVRFAARPNARRCTRYMSSAACVLVMGVAALLLTSVRSFVSVGVCGSGAPSPRVSRCVYPLPSTLALFFLSLFLSFRLSLLPLALFSIL